MVHSSTQHPSETQEIVARVLGLPQARGGGAVPAHGRRLRRQGNAGQRAGPRWPRSAATKIGRPVRVRLDAPAGHGADRQAPPVPRALPRRLRRPTARCARVAIELFSDGGWSLDLSFPVLGRAMFHPDNCYHVPHMDVVGRVCRTHHVSHTAFRGFGGPQGMLVIEEILDRVARRARPAAARRARAQLLSRRATTTHYGQAVRRSGAHRAHLVASCRRRASFEARWAEVAAFNAASPHVKRGLAITPVKFGISFTDDVLQPGRRARARLPRRQRAGEPRRHRDGAGPAHEDPADRRRRARPAGSTRSALMPTRTDKVPNTSATAASSGSDLNGAAVQRRVRDDPRAARRRSRPRASACERVRRSCSPAAASIRAASPSAASPSPRSSNAGLPGARAALRGRLLPHAGISLRLEDGAGHAVPLLRLRRRGERGRGRRLHRAVPRCCAPTSCTTSATRCRRCVDRGQVEGGFVQGVGWLTTEELVWDADGALRHATARRPTSCRRSASARRICASRSSSAPREPGVVHGSKAVGEPPLMLAISVREALRAAVAAFGAGGHRRARLAGDARSGVLGHRARPCATSDRVVRRLRSRVGEPTPELFRRPDRGA